MLRALSAHPVQGAHRVAGPPRKALGECLRCWLRWQGRSTSKPKLVTGCYS